MARDEAASRGHYAREQRVIVGGGSASSHGAQRLFMVAAERAGDLLPRPRHQAAALVAAEQTRGGGDWNTAPAVCKGMGATGGVICSSYLAIQRFFETSVLCPFRVQSPHFM